MQIPSFEFIEKDLTEAQQRTLAQIADAVARQGSNHASFAKHMTSQKVRPDLFYTGIRPSKSTLEILKQKGLLKVDSSPPKVSLTPAGFTVAELLIKHNRPQYLGPGGLSRTYRDSHKYYLKEKARQAKQKAEADALREVFEKLEEKSGKSLSICKKIKTASPVSVTKADLQELKAALEEIL
jgi:hypothetical protein